MSDGYDESVTVADVVTTVDYILERNPEPFNFNAADMDKDSRITVGDASRIVNLLLSESSNKLATRRITRKAGENNFEAKYLMDYSDKQLIITAENIERYVAAQFDLILPEDVSIESIELEGSSHAYAYAQTSTPSTRVVVYSFANETMSPDTKIVVTLD